MFAALRAPMIARVAAVIAISLFTGGAQYSCSSRYGSTNGRDIDSGNGPRFTTTLLLRDSSGAATYTFARGEPITFELVVRNRTTSTVSLESGHPPDSDYAVFDDGTERLRWRYNASRGLPVVVVPLVFQPGETRIFTITWNQVLDDGSMLGSGNFEARGVVPFVGFVEDPMTPHELGSNLVAFRIR